MSKTLLHFVLVTLSLLAWSCGGNNITATYSSVHLDSAINTIEDSIVKIEKTKIDSTAIVLAVQRIDSLKNAKDSIIPRSEIPNRPAPVVVPQIDKDSFEQLK